MVAGAGNRFNEAPALRGGNPLREQARLQQEIRFNEAPALRGGNLGGQEVLAVDTEASMRPPHCAGEIELYVVLLRDKVIASMRPPHCAGEITSTRRVGGTLRPLQ